MQKKIFNELDGLRIAIEIEKRGHEFYQQAYGHAQKDAHKELFLLLRDDENHHREKFEKLFDKVNGTKSENDLPFDEETSRYLFTFSDHLIFPQKEDAAPTIAGFKTFDAILSVALQAEKDSVLLYDELAVKSRSEEAKKIFAALKSEEQRHVVKLREMIDGWA
jgi:rubrerythrin